MKSIKSYHGAGVLFWTMDTYGQLFVLLGERSHHPQKGKWSIPAGGWDDEDSYDENRKHNYRATAKRETWEEINLWVDNSNELTYLWSRHLPFFHFVVYGCQLSEKKEFVHYQEFSQVKWFSAYSLPVNSVGFVRSQVATLVRQYHKGET